MSTQPLLSLRDEIVDTMINLSHLSKSHRIIVAGSDSAELYLALKRRGFSGQKPSSRTPVAGALSKGDQVSSFQRPDPEVLSRVIPVVFIGRNRDGFWVARDAEGKFGGLFWRKGAALRFAKENAGPAGCAAVFPQARFELDLDNSGNPLLGRLGTAKHLLMRWALRLTAIVRKRAQSQRPI